jgi:hypothetical protein
MFDTACWPAEVAWENLRVTWGQGRRIARLEAAYGRASANGDPVEAERLAREVLAIDATTRWALFDAGLFAKRRRDWPEALRLNDAALAVHTDPEGDPAAWNLGIAATAMGAWEHARRAWATYGIELPGGSGRIDGFFGTAPIRLNPEPRHLGDCELEIDGARHDIEVVWARRLCPARAQIISVPFPESGHRFGDVVLHDGEPVGTRVIEGERRAVFNELALLERSASSTWLCTVDSCDEPDREALHQLFSDAGLAAEDWTANVQVLCRACSEGDPDPEQHDHRPAAMDDPTSPRRFGLAGPEHDILDLLASWRAGGDRSHGSLERLLP